MPSPLTTLIALVILLATAGLYVLKNDTSIHTRRVNALNEEIGKVKEDTLRLRAEWHLLSAPLRLKRLADTHLELVPAEHAPEIDLLSIPFRNTNPADQFANAPSSDEERSEMITLSDTTGLGTPGHSTIAAGTTGSTR